MLAAGGPDRGPVEQGKELEDGAAVLGNGEVLLGEVLGGVEVAAFQGQPGQRAQVVHGEQMLFEPQPLGRCCGGAGGGVGFGEAAGLKPGPCLHAGDQDRL